MNKGKVKHIISQGEGISIEFKKVVSELPSVRKKTTCFDDG